jgi:hypothetical protein
LSPDLVTALRVDTPAAPDVLCDRIAAITATSPPPRRFTTRRILGFAAPAVAALSLVVAMAVGLNTAIQPAPSVEESPSAAAQRLPQESNPPTNFAPLDEPQTKSRTLAPNTDAAKAPAPSQRRAQDYRASLTLLVEGTGDLSQTTQRALRSARRLGGYLVSVNYATPEAGEGTAAVRLRIPVSRVQAAIVQFSGLGQILSQNTQIADLQQGLDELTRRIRDLERRAAQARGLERDQLLAQLAALRAQRVQINRQAAFATVDLNLTTHEPTKPEAAPGRFDRALDDAVGILLAELAIAAYVLIVASPLIILLIAGFFGARAYRHHADQRLLERA